MYCTIFQMVKTRQPDKHDESKRDKRRNHMMFDDVLLEI